MQSAQRLALDACNMTMHRTLRFALDACEMLVPKGLQQALDACKMMVPKAVDESSMMRKGFQQGNAPLCARAWEAVSAGQRQR